MSAAALPESVAEWVARYPRLMVRFSSVFEETLRPGHTTTDRLDADQREGLLRRLVSAAFSLNSVDHPRVGHAGLAVLDAVEARFDLIENYPLANWRVWERLFAAVPPETRPDMATLETSIPSTSPSRAPATTLATHRRLGEGYVAPSQTPEGPPVRATRRLTPGMFGERGRCYFRTLPLPLFIIGLFGSKIPTGDFPESRDAKLAKDRLWNGLVASIIAIVDDPQSAENLRLIAAKGAHTPGTADVLRDYLLVRVLRLLDDLPAAFWLRIKDRLVEHVARVLLINCDEFTTAIWRDVMGDKLREWGLRPEWHVSQPDLVRFTAPADWVEQTRLHLLGLCAPDA